MKRMLMVVFACLCAFVSGCASKVSSARSEVGETRSSTIVSDAGPSASDAMPLEPRPASTPLQALVPDPPPVILRVTSRATPRSFLPTAGNHLQIIAWSFMADGGDIRIPPIRFELNTTTGRVTNVDGTPYLRHFTIWNLDARRILAGPVEPLPSFDGRSTGHLSATLPTIIHDQETVVFVMTMDTSGVEDLEYASLEHLYRITLGEDESNLFDSGSVRTVDDREVYVVSNTPITRDMRIQFMGHPVVQPLESDQDLTPGEHTFLHWRLRSSGAPITLKRFVTAYNFASDDGRPMSHALTFWHERDGERLSEAEAQVEHVRAWDAAEPATSVRFMPEMFVGSDWIDFVVRGEVREPFASGTRLNIWMSLAPFTEAAGRLTPFERVIAPGTLGPHIWTSRDEPCHLIDPTAASSRIESGIFVWSPLTDGFHDDIPCGSSDWYGALYRDADRTSITNTLVAP